jgi:hypothetical protein
LPPFISKIALGALTIAITVILLIAANTAFVALPRLTSLLARDGFLPKQLKNRGDRQVYSIGVIALVVFASIPIWIFDAKVTPLIPLYGIGVFTTFSLLSWSIVRHAIRKPREDHADSSGIKRGMSTLVIGTVAGVTTSTVLLVFLITKFLHGAFAIVIVIPLLVLLMKSIRARYVHYENGLRLEEGRKFHIRNVTNTIILALGQIDRAALKAINRTQDIVGRKIAVHVAEDDDQEEKFRRQWENLETGIPLTILRTEYNSTTAPLFAYIKKLKDDEDMKEARDPSYIHHLYVVISEIIPITPFENLLHNQTAFFLYEELRAIPEVTPILVRYMPEKVPLGEQLWGFFKK